MRKEKKERAPQVQILTGSSSWNIQTPHRCWTKVSPIPYRHVLKLKMATTGGTGLGLTIMGGAIINESGLFGSDYMGQF